MVVTKEKHDNNYLTLDHFINGGAPKISNPEVPKKQEGGKFTTVAQELGERLNDYVRFTFSSEDFKEALKDKFGGNINQFNQNLILFALTLAHMEKAAEKDEELKKSLPSLQEKMKAVNENIGKIAKELGYTVSQYSLNELMGKDLNGVKETLEKDFGVKLKFEGLFSAETFAFIVNKFYPGSVNATVATVPIISDTEDKEGNKQKSVAQQVVLQQQQAQQQQAEQPVFKQPSEEKQNKDYHSPLRGAGKKFIGAGGVFFVLGGVLVLFAGSFFYLPLAAFGLSGMGLAALGFPLVFVGVVTWVAGVIDEAIHNRHVPKAPDEKEEEQEKKKRKKGEEKEGQGQKQQPTQGNETQEEKDTQQKGGENNNTQQQEGKH